MIDHVWTVVCSRSVIDKDSNNISLQDVIEQLTLFTEPGEPVVVPMPLEVVTLWARSDFNVPARGRARLTFSSPSEEFVVPPFEHDVDMSSHRRVRSRAHFQGLPIREPGRHTFRIELQNEGETTWHRVAAVPLQILFEAPEIEPTGE